jgi:glutamate carboxypeptidase
MLLQRSTVAVVLMLMSISPLCAAGLTPTERSIVAAVATRHDAALGLLEETVNVQSATENHAGVRAVGAIYAREYGALGFETRWIDTPPSVGRAGHFVAEHPGTKGKPRLLVIGHLDTVLQREPFRREGDRAYGSGAADMKGGNLIALEAIRALQQAGVLRGMNVTVVYTGDEEDPGEPALASRDALLAAARGSDIALGFEGAAPGKAVIGRRGIGAWRLHVTGEQAHSSGIFSDDRGYGAIFQAARILERFRTELREPNLTYNPSVMVGGTDVSYETATKSGTAQGKTNVIPREVFVEGDVRYLSQSQFDSVRTKMEGIVADALPHTGAQIEVENSYPSMAPTDGNRRVLGVLDAASRDLGRDAIVAQDPIERGAGDIAFVCNDGRLACLDGLGAMGDNDHAPGEYAEVGSLHLQAQRAALLMYRLTR